MKNCEKIIIAIRRKSPEFAGIVIQGKGRILNNVLRFSYRATTNVVLNGFFFFIFRKSGFLAKIRDSIGLSVYNIYVYVI